MKATSLLEQARRATVLVQYYALNSIFLRGTWTWNCNCFSQRFVSEEELKSAKFQLLFSSAESAPDMKFLSLSPPHPFFQPYFPFPPPPKKNEPARRIDERMDHQRLAGQLLYSQLCEGKHNWGRPSLRFKDTVKKTWI